jgi:hypothetical protein
MDGHGYGSRRSSMRAANVMSLYPLIPLPPHSLAQSGLPQTLICLPKKRTCAVDLSFEQLLTSRARAQKSLGRVLRPE